MSIKTIYEVQFEIAGTAAMFTRPDTGATPVSYPAPTYSAAKGMFESIARLKSACIRPTKVEICAPIHYHRYTTNYGGPLRKSNQLSKGSSYQLFATILVDVCYRVYGVVEELERAPIDRTTNHLHYLQDKFEKRLRNGRWYHVPCLGWNEFTPSYVGPIRSTQIRKADGEYEENAAWRRYCEKRNILFRDETKVEESIEQIIPSMLFSVFSAPNKYEPTYKQDVWIKKGVLEYVE